MIAIAKKSRCSVYNNFLLSMPFLLIIENKQEIQIIGWFDFSKNGPCYILNILSALTILKSCYQDASQWLGTNDLDCCIWFKIHILVNLN